MKKPEQSFIQHTHLLGDQPRYENPFDDFEFIGNVQDGDAYLHMEGNGVIGVSMRYSDDVSDYAYREMELVPRDLKEYENIIHLKTNDETAITVLGTLALALERHAISEYRMASNIEAPHEIDDQFLSYWEIDEKTAGRVASILGYTSIQAWVDEWNDARDMQMELQLMQKRGVRFLDTIEEIKSDTYYEDLELLNYWGELEENPEEK